MAIKMSRVRHTLGKLERSKEAVTYNYHHHDGLSDVTPQMVNLGKRVQARSSDKQARHPTLARTNSTPVLRDQTARDGRVQQQRRRRRSIQQTAQIRRISRQERADWVVVYRAVVVCCNACSKLASMSDSLLLLDHIHPRYSTFAMF